MSSFPFLDDNLYVCRDPFQWVDNWKFIFSITLKELRGEIMSQRTMFEAKCTSCGKTCTVPFKPTEGKPVYCRECFANHSTRPKETVNNQPISIGKEGWARRRDKFQTRPEDTRMGSFHDFTTAP